MIYILLFVIVVLFGVILKQLIYSRRQQEVLVKFEFLIQGLEDKFITLNQDISDVLAEVTMISEDMKRLSDSINNLQNEYLEQK